MVEDPPITETPARIVLDPARGLAIIDVDEVLALFVQGFDRYLRTRGHELRMDSFALFSNVYSLGATEPVDVLVGRDFFSDFFAVGCGALEPAPGAAEGLARLARVAQVVILTNAPEAARVDRGLWLKFHGMDYPMILNKGLKGRAVATLAAKVREPVMFVDDLLPNLDSVAQAAPHVHRFQIIADVSLRKLAPVRPQEHRMMDNWEDLATAGETVFGR